MKNADPDISARLERAVSWMSIDTERALADLHRAERRGVRGRRIASFAIVAAVALIAVVVVSQRIPSDEGFIQPGLPNGTLLFGKRTTTDPSVNDLFALDLGSGRERAIVPGIGSVTWAEFSPDGGSIALTVEHDGGARYSLVVARADGSDPVTIVEQTKDDPTLVGPNFVDVSWSPDGTRLAYSGRTIFRGRTVSVLSADGSGARVLDGHWEGVSWSPDGERLVLVGWPEGGPADRFDLYTMRPDGSGLLRLTDDRAREFNPSWSPDGTRIVFSRGLDVARDFDIYVVSADGSDPTQLTRGPAFDGVPVWSPDGSWIAFASGRDDPSRAPALTSIYAMRPDGSDERRILQAERDALFPLSWTN